MVFLGLWSVVFSVVEAFFGVLKSKGGDGLNFMFWTCLVIEFACACVQSAALFIGRHGAFRVEFENRGIRMWTSSLAVLIDGVLLVVEAVYIGRKLRKSSWFLRNLRLSIVISVVLFALLVAPAIPILITGFWPPINDCFVVNRSVLDPLTIIVTLTPVICPVVAMVAWRFVRELMMPKLVARYLVMFVAYVCYSGPVLALGILLMRTPSDCDKHTILLISNLIPAVVTCCSAFVLDVGTNPDSDAPDAPEDNIGAGLSDASVRTPEEFDMSRVSDGVKSHQIPLEFEMTGVLPSDSSMRLD